jgi:hypothetical protein
MEIEYSSTNRGLEFDDLERRKELLSKYKFSVITEGEFGEFDNLHKWIEKNINENGLEVICYGKTGYDFGFVEFFVSEKEQEEKLRNVIPNIFTTYPTARICKSEGYDITIDYDRSNKDAVIFPAGYPEH